MLEASGSTTNTPTPQVRKDLKRVNAVFERRLSQGHGFFIRAPTFGAAYIGYLGQTVALESLEMSICRLVGDRVELEGSCVFYLEGEVEI